jgi:hypothetical protein
VLLDAAEAGQVTLQEGLEALAAAGHGDRPTTQVEIEGEFLFKEIGQWVRGEPGGAADRPRD